MVGRGHRWLLGSLVFDHAPAANVALAPLARALAPFLAAQILVLGLTVAYPWLTHIAEPAVAFQPPLSDDEVRRRLEDIAPSAAPDD